VLHVDGQTLENPYAIDLTAVIAESRQASLPFVPVVGSRIGPKCFPTAACAFPNKDLTRS